MAARAIAELESACRICLMEFPGTMTDIHHKPVGANRIREAITKCIPIKICENDGGPRFICPQCLTKLQIVIQFREKAVNSDKLLQRLWGHQTKLISNQQIPITNNSASNLQTNTSSFRLSKDSSPVTNEFNIYDKPSASHSNIVYQSQSHQTASVLHNLQANQSILPVENISESNFNKNTDINLSTSFQNSPSASTRTMLLPPSGPNENRNFVITNTSNYNLSSTSRQQNPTLKVIRPETINDNADKTIVHGSYESLAGSHIERELADKQRINNSLSFPDSNREHIKSMINTTIEVCLPVTNSKSVNNSLKTYRKQVAAVIETLSTNVEINSDNSTPVNESVDDSNVNDRCDFIADLFRNPDTDQSITAAHGNKQIKECDKSDGKQASELITETDIVLNTEIQKTIPQTEKSIGLNKVSPKTNRQSRKRKRLTDLTSTDFETDEGEWLPNKPKQKRKLKRSPKKRKSVSHSKSTESDAKPVSIDNTENISMDTFDDLVAPSNDVLVSPPKSQIANKEGSNNNCAPENEFFKGIDEARTILEKNTEETDLIDEMFGKSTQQNENLDDCFGTNETSINDKKISLRDRSKIRTRKLSEENSDFFDDSDADQTWDMDNAETDTSDDSPDSDRSESDRFKRKKSFTGSRGRPSKICSIINTFSLNTEPGSKPAIVTSEQDLFASKDSSTISTTPKSSKTKHKRNKPGPLSSKPGPASSKAGPACSKPGPACSKPGPACSKPGPASSKPKPGPKSSKSSKSSSVKSEQNKLSEKSNSVDNKKPNNNAKSSLTVKKTIDNKTRKIIDYIVLEDDDEDELVIIETNGKEPATTKSKDNEPETTKSKNDEPETTKSNENETTESNENEMTESNENETTESNKGTDQQNGEKTNESANKEKQPTVYTQISECEHCENWFSMTEAEFVEHVDECRTLIHDCYLCLSRFKDIAGLQKHLGKKHLKELQVCIKCSKLFYSLMHYWNHHCDDLKNPSTTEEVEVEPEKQKYQCGVCERKYDTIKLFIEHFETIHNENGNNIVID